MSQTQNGQRLTYPIKYDIPCTWSINIIINILGYKYVPHVLLVEQVTMLYDTWQSFLAASPVDPALYK